MNVNAFLGSAIAVSGCKFEDCATVVVVLGNLRSRDAPAQMGVSQHKNRVEGCDASCPSSSDDQSIKMQS